MAKHSIPLVLCGACAQSGPFWTLTTLILTIFLSTSLGTALFSPRPTYSDPSSNTSTSEKDLTLLTSITTLIYVYGLAFPAAFWALTRYFALKLGGNEVESGSGAGGAAGWTLPEAWAIWGYGMVVWVPVSVSVARPIRGLVWSLSSMGADGVGAGWAVWSVDLVYDPDSYPQVDLGRCSWTFIRVFPVCRG